MSTDKLNRITAIASRQPAICPARHQVSPAVLEFRLQQVTEERDELAVCLLECAEQIQYLQELSGTDKYGPLDALKKARALLAKIGGG